MHTTNKSFTALLLALLLTSISGCSGAATPFGFGDAGGRDLPSADGGTTRLDASTLTLDGSMVAVDAESTSRDPWEYPANTPTAKGPTQALSCSWLDGNNCWKTALAELETQCPTGGLGRVNPANRSEIFYPSGLKGLRPNEVPAASPGTTLVLTPNFRFLRADGSACGAVRVKFGAPATVTIEVGNQVTYGALYGLNVTTVVCADGSAFSESPEDATALVCSDLATRKLAGTTPALRCFCSNGLCEPTFNGTAKGALGFAAFTQ
jgi:hypothetical protein